ncbi:hypothetical protein ACWEN3_12725 [Streptomyces sp. NPDC004561]
MDVAVLVVGIGVGGVAGGVVVDLMLAGAGGVVGPALPVRGGAAHGRRGAGCGGGGAVVGGTPCTTAADTNRVSANTWITDQVDYSTPTVTSLGAESSVAVPDPTSAADPTPLILYADAAPNDDDTGDHVNLTTDGYKAIVDAVDLTTLGPDN